MWFIRTRFLRVAHTGCFISFDPIFVFFLSLSYNGRRRNNGALLFSIFEVLNNRFKISFWAHSIENSVFYETVERIFHISASCRRKISKIHTYSIVHLRILILSRYPSICLSVYSTRPMQKLKYLTSIDTEFCALYFQDVFKILDALVHEKKASK